MESISEPTPHEDWNTTANESDEENEDSLIEVAEKDTEIIPQPTPFDVRFPEKVQFEWQQQQEQLEELTDEADRNINALLHP